jgi:hypothetical protein
MKAIGFFQNHPISNPQALQNIEVSTLSEHLGTISLENLRHAHALIESGKATGKIILEGF